MEVQPFHEDQAVAGAHLRFGLHAVGEAVFTAVAHARLDGDGGGVQGRVGVIHAHHP